MYINVSVKHLTVKNSFLYHCHAHYDENSCVHISLKVCLFLTMYRSGASEEDEWPVELLLHSDPSDIASNALSITCESEMNLTIIPLPSHNS